MSLTEQTSKAMLWALNIDTNVSVISPAMDHSYAGTPSAGFNWFHVQADAQDSKECLQDLGLQNEIIDALCTVETRPKAIQFGQGMLVYLRGINRNPDADPEDMVSLRIWLTDKGLVSARRQNRKLLSIQDVLDGIDDGQVPGNSSRTGE